MADFGLMIGPLPEARTTRRLSALLQRLMPRGSHSLTELMYASLPGHTPYTDVPTPSAGLAWRRSVAALDALIVVAPTHTRSIPGVLKNALDWAGADGTPGALRGMPVAIAGAAAPGAGTFASLQHLRTVLLDSGAVLLGQPERTFEVPDGSLTDDGTCSDVELFHDVEEFLRAAVGHAVHEMRASGREPSPALIAPPSPLAGMARPAPSVPQSPEVGIPLATRAGASAPI
ncbi:NADPH-dependent FMN reductase [Demequina zhanjiangensis]|uniref:NAD(P)H-dependent oxidoreductase n=1 Tax=Demequina zhanjiangensis TaxID=3051659 RepID=A0ABT8FYJ5_9MICO|nr:NAD(P)H-dependent oxidoreductase [Demequina sp. SYSU T00b26]MDN4471888.1 NAD(P)H-dependent oxidoreductase [Demequina sp. SYSU T00b26]